MMFNIRGRITFRLGFRIVLVLLFLAPQLLCADDLRDRLKDSNGGLADWWVYNDISSAMVAANQQNKPLFVTFRCVPCKDCAAFDADVANGNEEVRAFARLHFVSVRQVEMKGVDLSLFQFDYDLNWAGMFLNSDGIVYARYGTQSAEGADAYNSIDGLMNTMRRVLQLHANYPANKLELAGKQGLKRTYKTALDMPGLKNPAKYAQETTRSNCIHCHNIHDAEHQQALDAGTYASEMLYKYPLPENVGLKMERMSGVRVSEIALGSAAAETKIKPNEDVLRMNGQPICSIADVQWVLHHLPKTSTTLLLETSESGLHNLLLPEGWKKNDFSWRGSMWNAPPRIQAWLPELTGDALQKLGLPPGDGALEVRWINQESKGGKQIASDGLREKDIVIGLDEQPIRMDSRQFNAQLRRNYKVGDTLALTLLRNGDRVPLKITLVE